MNTQTQETASATIKIVFPVMRACDTLVGPAAASKQQRIDAAAHALLTEIEHGGVDAKLATAVLNRPDVQLKLGQGAKRRFKFIMQNMVSGPQRRARTEAEKAEAKRRLDLNRAMRATENKARCRGGSGGAGASKVVGPTNPKAIAKRMKKLAQAAGKKH